MIAAAALLLALSAPPLDSELVLQRYAAHLLVTQAPKTSIFSYNISQAGPQNIDQTHRQYREDDLVRDETLTVDGQTLHPKITRIARYRSRYAIETLAPRSTQYAFLFLRAVPSGNGYDYVYRAEPLSATGAFVVTEMTIDGRSYLPSLIRFQTTGASAQGSGSIAFARAGKYWVAVSANVDSVLHGIPARERIVFSGYAFPRSLPKSTFQAPKPLPAPVLPTF